MKIGIIGAGAMGATFARRLGGLGHPQVFCSKRVKGEGRDWMGALL